MGILDACMKHALAQVKLMFGISILSWDTYDIINTQLHRGILPTLKIPKGLWATTTAVRDICDSVVHIYIYICYESILLHAIFMFPLYWKLPKQSSLRVPPRHCSSTALAPSHAIACGKKRTLVRLNWENGMTCWQHWQLDDIFIFSPDDLEWNS